MKINIITRCTRTSNLLTIKEGVLNTPKGVTVNWHVVFDTGALKDIDAEVLSNLTDTDNVKLHFVKGQRGGLLYPEVSDIIRTIKSGWIYLLDDDNILHEDFYKTIKASIKNLPVALVHIVSQLVAGKDFTGQEIRVASRENTAFQKIDIAQMVINRSIFDTHSFSANYAADGFFIEEVLKTHGDSFVWIDKVLCHYNYLEKEPSAKIPKILYIGTTKPELKSVKYLSYEADELDVQYLENDSEVSDIVVSFNPDAIITNGDSWKEFPNLASLPLQFRKKWFNSEILENIGNTAYSVAMNSILSPSNLEDDQMISFFTPIYNTGEKLWNTYRSVRDQTYNNWEWVLVNDSTDGGKTLKIAEEIALIDPRVKVYDFREKSGGCIGESKYRCCSLAKGYILAELDHDDLLVETCAEDLHNAAQAHPDCGMFYGDTAEVNEEWENQKYGEGFALGYGSYRDEEYKGKLLSPANQQNINPKTIRHIVGVPNHIRAWRRSTYFEIGGHNRSLTIADDFELVIRSFLYSKICKIPKLSYIQFLYNNSGGRNTHDLSRADIQRRVRTISQYYNEQINARFIELGIEDWAYNERPDYPISAESRYGDKEGVANEIYTEKSGVEKKVTKLQKVK
jgi:glycosyltransferase involved in cell wall biosynthesis|tara:strand:+ start:803 stop:2677 length:1875 start_codon:yes stop_codon:yes gene_type:complete